jgi:hypothetical protein
MRFKLIYFLIILLPLQPYAQNVIRFEDNSCDTSIFNQVYNGCLKDWQNSHGTSVYKNGQLTIGGHSGVFLNYNFIPCVYYRLQLCFNDTNQIHQLTIAKSNSLTSSNQVEFPRDSKHIIEVNQFKQRQNGYILDSFYVSNPYTQLWIYTDDESVVLNNITLQPILNEQLNLDDFDEHTYKIYTSKVISTKQYICSKNAEVHLVAANSIDFDLGTVFEASSNVEASIQPLAGSNYLCEAFINDQNLINIYNLITKEKDNKNDYWEITNIEYFRNKVTVFNHLGEMVFSQYNYKSNWDGGNLTNGIYHYTVQLIDIGKTFKGTLIIN